MSWSDNKTFADHMAARVSALERERLVLKSRVRSLERSCGMWKTRALARTKFSRA